MPYNILRAFLVFIAVTLSVIFHGSIAALADCITVESTVQKKSLASASTWANIRGAEGSIAATAKSLLDAAHGELKNAERPEACSALCDSNTNLPNIVMEVIPNKYRSDSSDNARCAELLKLTEKSPLVFSDRKFPTIDAVNKWFSSFSAGRGPEGKELYDKCPGDCSPRYRNIIRETPDGFLLDSVVVCGMPRDKSDDQYWIQYSYEWSCKSS